MDTRDSGVAMIQKPSDDESEPLLGETEDVDAPKDTFFATYWIMFLFGIGSLLPWNMFINAGQYFKKELDQHYSLSTYWENYLIIAAQVPNVSFLFINAFYKSWLSERVRILVSLTVMFAMMLLTTILACIDTDSWQLGFFVITILSVFIMNVASAIFQGGVFGIVGKFPQKYRQAVMSGQGLGGIFAALAYILSLLGAGGTSQLTKAQLENSAIGYFSAAVFMIILSIFGYIVLTKLPFAIYYSQKNDAASSGQKASHRTVIQRILPMAISVTLVFFVTLSIFPAISERIISVNENDVANCAAASGNSSNQTATGNTTEPLDMAWTCTYFTPVICFLLFNVMDFIGRTTPTVVRKPGPRYLLFPVVARFAFIVLYLFCKYDADRRPYFDSDAAPIILMVAMAFSNGYLGTLSFMYAPSLVSAEDGETAGALMAAFLGAGLLLGVLFSFLSTGVLVPAMIKAMPLINSTIGASTGALYS